LLPPVHVTPHPVLARPLPISLRLHPRHLLFFPSRRSSDLGWRQPWPDATDVPEGSRPVRGPPVAASIAHVTEQPVTAPDPPPVSTVRVLTTLMVPLFMALTALSVINVALPVLGSSPAAGARGLQWVVSGYALSFGLLLVPSGRRGDATGRKRIFLAGVAVFIVGAVVAGFAQSIEMLNLARVVQGVGSGMLNPQTFGLIQKYFRKEARARAFATMATTVSVATASGPLVGGLLIEALGDDLGWRAMFLVNVPLGILALVLGRLWLPDDRAIPTPADVGPDTGVSRARAGAMARLREDGSDERPDDRGSDRD